jgi:hypothetical protein
MRGVRCEGFVAAHGGVPPSGPLLLGLLVEVVLPCPRLSFISWQTVGISIEICQTNL